MTDLVIGATGHLGGMIAGRLLERGGEVRALVRPGFDAASLEAAGAELARGDLKDPHSLAAACRGVRRIVASATAAARGGDDTVESVDRAGYKTLLRAAGEAAVERFLFVSAHGFTERAPLALARAKAATAAALAESTLDHTILEPTLFMDSWIAFVLGAQLGAGDRVTIIGDPDREHGFVAAADVAALAVACLDDPRASRAVVPFSTVAVSYRRIVATIEEVTGRSIEIESVDPGTSLPGLPTVVNDLWSWLASGDVEAIETPETAAAYGLEPIGLRPFIEQVFGSG